MKTHRPLFLIAIFFSTGILLNEYANLSFKFLFSLTAGALLLGLFFRKAARMATFLILLTFIFLGGAYAKINQHLPKTHIKHIARYYPKQPVLLEGRVITDVKKVKAFGGIKTTFTLNVQRFETRWGWKRKKGKVLVNIFRDVDLGYGDDVRLQGRLHPPFEFSADRNFSYPNYLRQRGIYLILSVKRKGIFEIIQTGGGFWLKRISLNMKHRLNKVFDQYLSKNEAAMMQAVILGDREHIPQHLRELFVQTGTAHILAISGLHVGIVAFLVLLVLKLIPMGRRWHFILTISFLIFYAFLTGARPSVVRATIMAVVLIASFLVERETDGINTLSLAAIMILLMNPLNLFDVGFQLSFVSVLSIIYLCPKIIKIFKRFMPPVRNKLASWLIQSLSVSIAAGLGSGGLIAYYFSIITPVGIIANLFIVPFIALVVALGLGLLAAGTLFPLGAFTFALCLKVTLNAMVAGVYLLSQLPGAYFYTSDVSLLYITIYYLFILGLSLKHTELTK